VSTDRWADGSAYESFIGRWSRRVAPEFLAWLDLPPDRRWVDVGCGTGALSATILSRAAPQSVVGVDPSPHFVSAAAATIRDRRARFEVGAADGLPIDGAAADVAVAGLVLNFVPDVDAALAEMRRVVADGGTIGAYVWDYGGRMDVLRRFWDAAIAVDPTGVEADEASRFPICAPGGLAAAFTAAGFADVDARPIDIAADFIDFDDYWKPFLSGVGPAPGYTVRLPDDRRAALRERLRATLPTDADGSIHLNARAWAARARV
jgi:SAM-dependent methyltransferase